MSKNGDDGHGPETQQNVEAPVGTAGEQDAMRLPDVSPEAVNARLRAFVAEVRAKPAAERRESDLLLVAFAQDALDHQERADRQLAEAEAKQKHLEEAYALDRNARAWWDRGGGLQ
jgi:hypothetical protein